MAGYIIPTEAETFELAKIKANLIYYRGKAGFNTQQMAEAVGVCESTYISYEDNPRKLYATMMLRICRVLKINYNELFGVNAEYRLAKKRIVVEEVIRITQ